MPYVTVDPEIVSALLAACPVTRDELHAIRDPRDPMRYQGVYGHRHGGINRGDSRYTINFYRARVFKFFELGSGFASAEDAARAVVAFYRAHYGERWQKAFRHRKVTPWRLRRVRRESASGFAVDVYLRGCPVRVTHADVHGRSRGACERDLWGSPQEAKDAARKAMQRWFAREAKALTIPAPGLLFWRG